VKKWNCLTLKNKKMGVYLREKKLGNGQVSFYLDIYHNKYRWYEFLDIRINKSRPSAQDKEKKLYAQQIKIKRENELIVEDNGLINRGRQKADFVKWFEKYSIEKSHNRLYKQTLNHLKIFLDKKPLTFQAINPEWIKSFIKHLLTKMCNNTARHYIKSMNTALKDAEKADVIRKNPFSLMDRKDLVKKQDSFRKAFSLEELQNLIDTPCDIHPHIKQAYLFSCFSGLRWSDINSLRWDQITVKKIDGVENYFIYFQQEKTEAIEYLPLSAQAINILKRRKKELLIEEKSIYIFSGIKEYSKNGAMNRKVNYCLKKWADASGLDSKTMHFHTARHTFATNVLEHCPDGDLWTVSKLLGHKTIQATQIYAQIRDKRKATAVRALPILDLQGIQ
jgi:integrase